MQLGTQDQPPSAAAARLWRRLAPTDAQRPSLQRCSAAALGACCLKPAHLSCSTSMRRRRARSACANASCMGHARGSHTLGLAAVGCQQLGGPGLAPSRRRRDELAQLGARVLQLAQLHLYPHRHPLEAPECLRMAARPSRARCASCSKGFSCSSRSPRMRHQLLQGTTRSGREAAAPLTLGPNPGGRQRAPPAA